MSSGQRYEWKVARPLAESLVERLSPACEQIAIAGSIRRGKKYVGDIELVAIPLYDEVEIPAQPGQMDLFGNITGATEKTTRRESLLNKKLEDLAGRRVIEIERPYTKEKARWGEKQKEFWHMIDSGDGISVIKCDLFIVTAPAQFGPIMTIRTGPGDFSHALMTWINFHTDYRQTEGHLEDKATGKVVETPTEESYFEALELDWIKPAERNLDTLKERQQRTLARRKRQEQRQQKKSDSELLTDLERVGYEFEKKRLEEMGVDVPEFEETPQQTIKALTLHQPWASLIAIGSKQYETRDWATPYRGLLAIHAAKRPVRESEITNDIDAALLRTGEKHDRLPLGAVLCIVRLIDVVSTESVVEQAQTDWRIRNEELEFGNFAPGRYAWKLEIVKVFDEPILARGQQGLWEWDGWDGVIDEQPAESMPTLEGLVSVAAGPELDHPKGIGYENLPKPRAARFVGGDDVAPVVLAVLRKEGAQTFGSLRGFVEGRMDRLFNDEFWAQVVELMTRDGMIIWDHAGNRIELHPLQIAKDKAQVRTIPDDEALTIIRKRIDAYIQAHGIVFGEAA